MTEQTEAAILDSMERTRRAREREPIVPPGMTAQEAAAAWTDVLDRLDIADARALEQTIPSRWMAL